jgi:pimeloyl-ACP methyl ester carboxylesterase
MGLASLPKTPIGRLVLNDVGPAIRFEALTRISGYLGQPLRWRTVEEAADYLQTISASFGPHTRAQWLALSRPMLKPDGDGFRLHYDPAIAVPIKAMTPELAAAGEALTWAAYDAVRCPTLLLRGAESDLLGTETAQAMTQRGPKARLVEFAGVGHAPTLVAADQIAAVREFLLGSDTSP